jgi:hypothetical protein
MRLAVAKFTTQIRLPDGRTEGSIDLRSERQGRLYTLSLDVHTRAVCVTSLQQEWTVRIPLEVCQWVMEAPEEAEAPTFRAGPGRGHKREAAA